MMTTNITRLPVSASVLYRPIFLVSFAFTFLGFGLPIYSKSLGASAVAIGGLYSVFTVTILVGRPLVGWALDRFGRRRFFVAALIGYAITMTLFALAKDLTGLYLARFIQGIASSFMWITVRTIVADLSAPEARGQLMGRVTENGARGEIVGVFLGFTLFGILPSDSGWPVIFCVYAALAFAAAGLAWKNVPETRPPTTTAVAASSILSPSLFKLLIVVFTTGLAMALISPIYLIFLQDKFTADISVLAWAFLPAGLVYGLLPSRLGKLSDRFGRAPLMAAGLVTAGILSLLLPTLPNLFLLALFFTLEAVGWSMAGPAEAAMVADLTGHEARGRGYGLYEFAASLGATVGPLFGGWLYDALGKPVPFYVTGAILLVSTGWVLIVLRQRSQAGTA